MGLIRQNTQNNDVSRALAMDLGDLAAQGERLRALAMEEAERILAEARKQRDQILKGANEQGRAEGYAVGLREGREQGHAEGLEQSLETARTEFVELHSSWSAALDDFLSRRERLLLGARHDVVRLAVLLSERIVKRTIELDPGVVEDQLASVLSLVSAGSTLRVFVHPEDRPRCEGVLPGAMSRLGRSEHVDLHEDATLARGSCVVRTPSGGEIDASIGEQLRRAAEVLLPGESFSNGKKTAVAPGEDRRVDASETRHDQQDGASARDQRGEAA